MAASIEHRDGQGRGGQLAPHRQRLAGNAQRGFQTDGGHGRSSRVVKARNRETTRYAGAFENLYPI
ncbi:Uncharacterised protein [Acinetobacter baumannii]|nr:Uncharacterised protein [Acinetobacter baumannii]